MNEALRDELEDMRHEIINIKTYFPAYRETVDKFLRDYDEEAHRLESQPDIKARAHLNLCDRLIDAAYSVLIQENQKQLKKGDYKKILGENFLDKSQSETKDK